MVEAIKIKGEQLFSIFQIDDENFNFSRLSIMTEDIEKYTSKLLFQSLAAKNKRSYEFKRETSEIALVFDRLLNKIDDENFEATFEQECEIIAARLLDSQKKYRERYPGIKPPKKGSLVVNFLKRDEKIDFLISKIDERTFLDLVDSKYTVGLPEENATQKSCIISFNLIEGQYIQSDIVVTDSQVKISTFWAEEFLELKELKDNERNTKHSFNSIEQIISRNIKSKSKADYVELRNNLVGYYRTNTSFRFDDMINYVIGSYVPEDSTINIDNIRKKIEELPEKKNFDTAFDISVGVIKARFKKTYKVSDKIELRTSDYIDNLKEIIVAKENELGEKILEIKNISEEVYESFKEKED